MANPGKKPINNLLRRVAATMLRRSLESAVKSTAETAATVTTKSFTQYFDVTLPTTIYVRASQCQVSVQYQAGSQVKLTADLRASFGWEVATEQDEAGVYIAARRKLVVGQLSTARLVLTVPPGANLVFHLTPGSLRFVNIDGQITIPGLQQPQEPIAESVRTGNRP